MVKLVDDGTLDTVFICTECGKIMRYTFDGAYPWDEFRKEVTDDAQTHVCGEDD